MKSKALKVHPESLVNLTLVRQLLTDPIVQFQPRAIDANWYYEKALPYPLYGFNPLQGEIYYSSESHFAKWLKSPKQSARIHNYKDQLLPEVWAAVHEYLHLWALAAMKEIWPKLSFGFEPVTTKNFEDFVFVHLLTEVVASVGTDYWFLCTLDLNKECNLGTRFRGGLQTPYHESHIEEYRAFSPQLNVQHKDFFKKFADVYLKGLITDFDESSLNQSPQVNAWLTHELHYGEIGRKWTRKWIEHYSEGRVQVPEDQLEAAAEIDKPWKKELMAGLADLLWEKVKEDKIHRFVDKFDFQGTWRSDRKRPPNFRFTNLNMVKNLSDQSKFFPKADPVEFQTLFYQLQAQHRQEKFDPELIKLFSSIMATQDLGLALSVFKHQPIVEPCPGEPYDLFLLP